MPASPALKAPAEGAMNARHAQRRPRAVRQRQKGLFSLAGLGWLVLGLCVVALLLKAAPALGEHARIQVLVRGIAAASPTTPQEVQEAFDRQKSIDRIESLNGRDLVVTREDGITVISYAYDRRIALFDRVFLVIRYEGTTREDAQ
jgi:hypothetical protein